MQELPNIPRSGAHRPFNFRPFDYRFEAALRRSAWAWCRDRIASAIARLKARRTIRALNALTDRQLRDIGLYRSEIETAAARNSQSSPPTAAPAVNTRVQILLAIGGPTGWPSAGGRLARVRHLDLGREAP